jgi:glycosyltransferase involved in cell wall biosynthesis
MYSIPDAVLLGALYAKRKKIPHLWHVHEIIKHPKIISKIYPILVDQFSDIVVYNSKASKFALCEKRVSLAGKSQVVWNGLDREQASTELSQINEIRRTRFKAQTNQSVIGLVGRINRWKGHLLLIESFNEVLKDNPNSKLVFIGSTPPNQEFFKDKLINKIKCLNLEEYCEIIPFDNNIWPMYDSLDIVVVPSTEPEPFGLVAVEAMLSKKIVIVADHGGLSEIVENNKTGFLFKPNNKEDLIRCLNKALQEKDFSNEIAKQGFELAKSSFSLEKYLTSFENIYLKILKD